MIKISKYLLVSILKSRFMLGYSLLLFAICTGLFLMSNDQDKAIIGIHNILLIMIPLVVMIYSVSEIYHATDFIRLLLTQPIKRKAIFFSQYLSNVLALLIVQLTAIGLSIALFSDGSYLLPILLNCTFLTVIFSSISSLIAYKINEKVKGIGVTIFLGIYFLAIYDGLILFLIQGMSDYPIEKYGILLSLFNPIDLCRILFIFKMDVSALMGLTGAIMQKFLGSALGSAIIYLTLLLWAIIPLAITTKLFIKKDY
ncbi:MAG: ABC transporter permease subunit [bacterium]|nr:ABC transporter permease subunit [bacterium]